MRQVLQGLHLLVEMECQDSLAHYVTAEREKEWTDRLIRKAFQTFGIEVPEGSGDATIPVSSKDLIEDESLDKVVGEIELDPDSPALVRIAHLLSLWVMMRSLEHIVKPTLKKRMRSCLVAHMEALAAEMDPGLGRS